MAETSDRSIKKWVEENSSVSAVAAELGYTRPTIYKYIEKFDSGEHDKLPGEVVAYFEQKLASKDDPQFIQMKMELLNESMMLESKLELERARMSNLLSKKDYLSHQIVILKSSKDDADSLETIKKMMIDLDVLSKECMASSDSMHKTEERLKVVKMKISELENVKYIPSSTKPIFKIKSSCFIENGKCMIVHTGGETMTARWGNDPETEEPLYYRLHLYAKIGNEYAHLGEYSPVKFRNFFIIDDVFLSAPLYYNIVSCIADPQFEAFNQLEPGEDPPLVEISGNNSTGICELKQSR